MSLTARRHVEEPVATVNAGAFRGLPRPQGGDQAAGSAPRNPASRNQASSTRSIVIRSAAGRGRRDRRARSGRRRPGRRSRARTPCACRRATGIASAVTMKNCEPFVLGPAFAIASAPRVDLVLVELVLERVPGPPVPSPFGQPAWIMKSGITRWNGARRRTLAGELREVLDGLGRLVGVELDLDRPFAGVERRLCHAPTLAAARGPPQQRRSWRRLLNMAPTSGRLKPCVHSDDGDCGRAAHRLRAGRTGAESRARLAAADARRDGRRARHRGPASTSGSPAARLGVVDRRSSARSRS